MKKDEVTKKILAILEHDDPLPKETMEEKLDYRYLDNGHIDSFAIINLIVEIEVAFDIVLSPEDTQSDEFRTPGGLVTLITERVAA